jgi:hypothetical protein
VKKLLPLVVIAGALFALVWLRQTGDKPVAISDQVSMKKLVPDDVTTPNIAKIEMFNGDKPDEKLVLVREEGSDTKWRATTHFNAPVQQKKIDDYIKELRDLQGEFRATAKDDKDLEGFELTDAKAFHVVGYAKDGKELFNVLAGKAPNFQTVFVRNSGGMDVYVQPTSLRSNAGFRAPVTSEASASVDTTSPASSWVDKTVVDLDKDKIRKVAITTPDRSFVFEAKAKETPPAPKPEGETPDPAKAPEPEKPVEYEWKVAQGGFGTTHKQPGVDALIRKLDILSADDIVDPAKISEWGLDNPSFKLTVSVEGGEDTVIEGARTKADDPGYVRVASAKEQFVYKVSKFGFDQLFPKASDLFELPALSVDKNAIDRIEITQPEGNVVLTKQDGKWAIAEPVSDLEIQSTSIEGIATALGTWKAADYSDANTAVGLDAPTRKAVFTAGPNTTHTLVLGNDAKSTDGVYVHMDDNAATLVMARTDLKRIFIAPKDLVQRGLFEIDSADITSIKVDRASDSFELAKADAAWKLTVDGVTSDADTANVELVTDALSGLQAETVLYGQAELSVAPELTLHVKLQDGPEHMLVMGKTDSGYQLKLDARQQVFTISAADAASLTPPSATLKKAEPAPTVTIPAAPGEPAPTSGITPTPETPAATVPAEPAPEQPAAVTPVVPAPEPPVTAEPPSTTPAAPEIAAPPVVPDENPATATPPSETPTAPSAPAAEGNAPVVEPAPAPTN